MQTECHRIRDPDDHEQENHAVALFLPCEHIHWLALILSAYRRYHSEGFQFQRGPFNQVFSNSAARSNEVEQTYVLKFYVPLPNTFLLLSLY